MYSYVEINPKRFQVIRKSAAGLQHKFYKIAECTSESMALAICEAMEGK